MIQINPQAAVMVSVWKGSTGGCAERALSCALLVATRAFAIAESHIEALAARSGSLRCRGCCCCCCCCNSSFALESARLGDEGRRQAETACSS